MNKLKYTLVLIALFLLRIDLSAQIFSTHSDYERVIHNPSAGDSTFIFTYYSTNLNPITLKAKNTDNNAADFKWYRFVNSSQAIDPTPFREDYSVAESVVPVLEGGYMVVVSNPEMVDTFRTWVFYDIMGIDSISHVQNCDFMQLTANVYANRDNFFSYDYYDFCDLNNVVSRFITNTFTVEWGSSTDIYAGLPNMPISWKIRTGSLFTRISPTPLIDAKYSAKITNVFGNTSEIVETNIIPAMGTYAAFDVLILDGLGIYAPTTNLRGEALMKLRLDNKSVNANKFEWIGWNDQTINFLRTDTLWTYNTEHILNEFEYTPGQYPIKLTAENTQTGCRHSTYSLNSDRERSDIIVEKSSFNPASLPNVFTPNGDGNNDFFIFVNGMEPVSMRTMDIQIMSRNGSLVYKYKGSVSSWEGWNGKINGNGSDCSSGVYYYVISGEGWDDKSYSGKSYTGVLHLFRGK